MHPGPQVVTRAGFGAVKCQNHRHRHPLPVVIHGTKVNKLIIGLFFTISGGATWRYIYGLWRYP